MNASIAALAYLAAGVLFILSLRGLSSPETSRRGNTFGMVGMGLAIGVTLLTLWGTQALDGLTLALIAGGVVVGGGLGAVIARRVPMTSMPQLVAAFHSLVGMAACLVAVGAVYAPVAFGIDDGAGGIKTLSIIELGLGLAIGAITFTGSVIAFAKLNGNMSGTPILLPARHMINIGLAAGLVVLIGILIATGGTGGLGLLGRVRDRPDPGRHPDHPHRRGGHAGGGVHAEQLLRMGGGGAGLHAGEHRPDHHRRPGGLVRCDPQLHHVQGHEPQLHQRHSGRLRRRRGGGGRGHVETRPVKQGSADDAAFIMKNASKVIIVPGYGMAVAQAQHALREMADKLKEEGVEVKYAIHPVAGRMPGHMNVLLAEANVPYDEVFELEDINSEFSSADVAFVIGANDVTNPAAKTDPQSPIFGMPILDVEKAGTVLFVKRGMSAGYAGVENELFFRDNTMMLFADAKKMVEGIVKGL